MYSQCLTRVNHSEFHGVAHTLTHRRLVCCLAMIAVHTIRLNCTMRWIHSKCMLIFNIILSFWSERNAKVFAVPVPQPVLVHFPFAICMRRAMHCMYELPFIYACFEYSKLYPFRIGCNEHYTGAHQPTDINNNNDDDNDTAATDNMVSILHRSDMLPIHFCPSSVCNVMSSHRRLLDMIADYVQLHARRTR